MGGARGPARRPILERWGRMGRARSAGCPVPSGCPQLSSRDARLHFVSWKEAQCALSLLQTSLPLSTLTPGGSYARPEVTGREPSQLARKGPWLNVGRWHVSPGIGLFSVQESSVCWAGWSTSPWAHLCIGVLGPAGPVTRVPCPFLCVQLAGLCARAGGVKGSGCVVFTSSMSTHVTWLENMEGAPEGISSWVSGAEREGLVLVVFACGYTLWGRVER